MKNLLITLILIIIFSLALLYIARQKKRGAKCIGCPYAGECGKNSDCGVNCGVNEEKKESE